VSLRYALPFLGFLLLTTGMRCERVEAPPDAAGAERADSVVAPLPLEIPSGALIPIGLPTSNRALFTGHPEEFYQGVDKDTVAGLRAAAWEAGQYGFVRDPIRSSRAPSGRVFRRLHEGLDIRALYRDAAGEPLDTVRAIADGRVAYVSAGYSAYGNYVVVEHRWSDSPVYSLYAHLDTALVAADDRVERGDVVGRMGYTGRGLRQDRAHVHLEVALLLNRQEPRWFAQYVGLADLHGVWFGTNLAGVDVASLYRTSRLQPDLDFAAFIRAQPPGFRVLLPGSRPLDLLARYPWLLDAGADAEPDAERAWVVTFTRAGVPARVGRRSVRVDLPRVDGVVRAIAEGGLSTNRLLRIGAAGYELTDLGRRYLALLATTEDGPPAW